MKNIHRIYLGKNAIYKVYKNKSKRKQYTIESNHKNEIIFHYLQCNDGKLFWFHVRGGKSVTRIMKLY